MKALNNFLNKAHLFKIYLLGVAFTGTFIFILFQFAGPALSEQGKLLLASNNNIKFSLILGLILGLMFMLMISMSRKSSKYWEYAEVVEKLIEDATTKQELKNIYANEFKELRHLAQGSLHYQESKRIYAILETKHKYIKE